MEDRLDKSAVSGRMVFPDWKTRLLNQVGVIKGPSWETLPKLKMRPFLLFLSRTCLPLPPGTAGCALRSNPSPKAKLCTPPNHYVPAFNHWVQKVIRDRLLRPKPNSLVVPPIRIKTPEVRIPMRRKVAKCIVREETPFLVTAARVFLSVTGRISSDDR